MPDYSIREAAPTDAESILEYLRVLADEPDNTVMFSSADEVKFTVEQEQKVLEDAVASDNSIFVVALSNDGLIISVGNLSGGSRLANRQTASLGVSVRQGWRDQGVGKAMMQYMIDWARESGVIHRLELDVYAHNPRAIHLYEKMGFQIEGRRRADHYKYGKYVDTLIMGLLLQD